jgi:hypothetical protein
MRSSVFAVLVSVVIASAPPVAAQSAVSAADRVYREHRYQIDTMERVLENAVEHGAAVMRDRLQALLPADMLLSENARARGFRLDGYGVFFDVVVPNLEGTMPWVFRTLDQTDLGLESALGTLRAMVDAQGGDPKLQQALKRIELQVAPFVPAANISPSSSSGVQPSAGPGGRTGSPADPILSNPEEAYRAEVTEALMDAMLNHSRGLDLAAGEWLTVGARRDNAPRVSVGDSPARTIQIGVRADDLRAFLGGEITRDEARKRMDVRVF